nr:glycoside hydrolase/phage tail family protein [uncultured Cohaesibacter sp.]
MTTLVLRAAGTAIGGALLGPFGAVLGGALGAIGGSYIDQKLFGSTTYRQGSQLSDLSVLTSTEGMSIPRLYGRSRMSGQVIWATNLIEEVTSRKYKTSAAKGASGNSVSETTYSYFANFAVGLCEGEISYIGRVWANGTILDLEDITYRVYRGTEDQLPDSLIEAKQGTGNAPAYRGLAYVVFEELPLEDFGNRIPQLSFEVVRSIGTLEKQVQSVVMIPGSTEFGYDTQEIARKDAEGEWSSENRHSYEAGTDFEVSLEHLMALCPNLKHIALVVTWFGTDLRASHCEIRPMVDDLDKVTDDADWSVAGLSRSQALQVCLVNDRPAFGGTPSDETVLRAIEAIKDRGLGVVLYPFVMMNVSADNELPDPYGAEQQAAFPWRGRITCYPGPGQSDSADQSTAATEQIGEFYAQQEWSYHRFIVHYAELAAQAGGVDGFLIGSELRGLTQLRDEQGNYPFVACLKTLAADVRACLGSDTDITYGADWSEYFGHHPSDRAGTVNFHLDELWADDNIDAIGIDNYMPLSDWRAGEQHLDASLADTGLESDYLQSNIAGGEGYDWYYQSQADRDNQIRTQITDGAADKAWVYRYKDLINWWSNQHYNRQDAVEVDTPTDWVPCSKPIWFTEIGCPAVHLGPNQPNVFPDAKSSESALPYYSSGARSDAAQRAMLSACLDYWQSDNANRNPASALYDGPMVAADHIYLWAWDARPFPAFPLSGETWSDGDAWHTGHWLNGRLGSAPLQDILAMVLSDYGLEPSKLFSVPTVLDGFVIDSRMSVRDALEDLCDAFNISFVTSGGQIRFEMRERRSELYLEDCLLIDVEDEPLLSKQMSPWEEEPSSVTFSFSDLFQDYRQSVAQYDQPCARTRQQSSKSLSVVSTETVMTDVAKNWLRNQNFARHSVSFKLPLSMLSLEAGDLFRLEEEGGIKTYRIEEIEDGTTRDVTAQQVAPRNSSPNSQKLRSVKTSSPQTLRSVCIPMELPLLPGKTEYPHAPYIASYCAPWPGGVLLYEGSASSGYVYRQTMDVPAIYGTLLAELPGIECYGRDLASTLLVKLVNGDLSSVDELSLFAGANAAAVQKSDDSWEIIQFSKAELVSDGVWKLQALLRGQIGTEANAAKDAAIGARFVLLDEGVKPLEVSSGKLETSVSLKAVPSGATLEDAKNTGITVDISGRGLLPLSPVHMKLAHDVSSGGNWVSWIRRDRQDADSWVDSEIPLSEAVESYSISVCHPDSGETLRTANTQVPEWFYSASDQSADGIDNLSEIVLKVAQISRRVGAGDELSRRASLTSLRVW